MLGTIITSKKLLLRLNLRFGAGVGLFFTRFSVDYIIPKFNSIVIITGHPEKAIINDLHLNGIQAFLVFWSVCTKSFFYNRLKIVYRCFAYSINTQKEVAKFQNYHSPKQ